jgi:hypothetical protein
MPRSMLDVVRWQWAYAEVVGFEDKRREPSYRSVSRLDA